MDRNSFSAERRVLLLMKASTYRAPAFLEAAASLGVEVVSVVDTPATLGVGAPGKLAVDFEDREAAVATLVAFARETPVAADR